MPLLVRICCTLAAAGLASSPDVRAQAPSSNQQNEPPQSIIKSQHLRFTYPADVVRVAVGDGEILSAEIITSREVLVLGRETGRTTLIVWLADGTIRESIFAVQRDLALLRAALKRIDPSLEAESAPDRDAIVLTGRVANALMSQTAEAVARGYLDAGQLRRGAARPLLAAPSPPPPPPDAAAPGGQPPPPAAAPPAPQEAARLQGELQPSSTIINLIQLETLPALPEDRILDAVRSLAGDQVSVHRLLHGNVRDDAQDTLILEGRVPNQVALVRLLTIAAQLFAGQTITENDIRVVADEAGALAEQAQAGSLTQQPPLLGGGATASLFGGNRSVRLTNQVRRNLARAKAIEVAGGRILSFIEVSDLPQIRVAIRLLEINRSRLRALDVNSVLIGSDFQQPSLNPAQSSSAVQGDRAPRVGFSTGSAIQNVLSFLSGGLLNQFQFAGEHGAIDVAVSFLEREGIARSLSSPTLTVLSGETAQVQVGGEVPVPVSFAPAFGAGAGAATPGVFNSVEFVPFGVQLEIRPLAGEDDSITLDVQPIVVTPDPILTAAIRQTTGTTPPTTAFQTRALRTSSRLMDGQALLIGGLVSNNTSSNTATTPGLGDLPIVGGLFHNSNRNDQSTELVVMVNPVVIRTPVPQVALWAFPDRDELLRSIAAGVNVAAPPAGARKED